MNNLPPRRKLNKEALTEKLMLSTIYGLGFFGYNLALYIAVIVYMPSRLVTMPHRALMLGVSLLAIFYMLFRGRSFYRGRLWIPLLVFWGAFGLRVLFESFTADFLPHPISYYLLYGFGVCAVPMVPFMVRYTRSGMRLAFWAMLACAMGSVIMTFALYGLGGGGRAKGGDFVGDFVAIGPLIISYMGSGILVLGFYSLIYPQNFRGLSRWFEYFMIGFLGFSDSEEFRGRMVQLVASISLLLGGSYMLIMGASRGPIMAVVGCVLFIAFAKVKNAIDIFKVFVVLALFGLVAVCGLFISQAMGSALVYRLTELLDIFDIIKYGGYGADRVFMWQAAIAQWLESPFFGRGLILEAYFTYPHNAVLEAFMTTGVIGGSAFLIFLIGCLVKAYQLLKHAPEYGWVAVLFVHYAIYVQFSSSITINSYFWYSAAGVLGLVHSLKDSGQWGRPMLRRR